MNKYSSNLVIALLVGNLLVSCGTTDSSTTSVPKSDAEMITAGENHWEYSISEDKMSSSQTKVAYLISSNLLEFGFPYDGGSYGQLSIRRKDGQVDIYLKISKGQFMTNITEGVPVRLRFDNQKAITCTGSMPDDYSSDFMFLSPTKTILKKLKKSKKLYLEAGYYQSGNQILEFDVSGLKWD
jgi:hypothetical protein